MKVHLKFHRTNYGKFSLKAKGTSIWNDLPYDTKKSKSYFTLKGKMKLTLHNSE